VQAAPDSSMPDRTMLDRIVRTITRYRMFEPDQRAGVAVSGGADSVCLLHVLRELALRWNLSLTVLHLDHNLRGDESRADAEFVARLAARLGLPFELGHADVAALRRETGDNLEQAARHARLRFFRGFLEAGRFDRIALGHTLSDQAETVLFRFLRGAATAGLSGIRPTTGDGLVRPLIEIERAGVEQYLRARGIGWREDSTNSSLAFARNRIRHELLPQLTRDWNPALAETLAHTAEWAQAEEQYWNAEIARMSEGHLLLQPPAVLLRAAALTGLPLAAARRLVRHAAEIVKGNLHGIGFEHLSAVLDLAGAAEGHGRVQLPGIDVFRSFDWLRLAPPGTDSLENRNYRFALPVPGKVQLPGQNCVIQAELVNPETEPRPLSSVYNEDVECLDWSRISGLLEVRNWRPGDQYQPANRPGAEKIKDLFQQARIPLWERRHWPIITSGETIIWARRFGPAAGFAAPTGVTPILAIREIRA
jgi:tRNA(Ile)-lysidine synthase